MPLVGGRDLVVTMPRDWRTKAKIAIAYDSPVRAPISRGAELGKLVVSGQGVPDMERDAPRGRRRAAAWSARPRARGAVALRHGGLTGEGRMAAPGRFITLEGGEGAGKSTQARRLVASLAGVGVEVIITREPGGAPGAEVLRGLLLSGEVAWSPLAEVLLHFAASAEHVAKTILPALESGLWVVCDRFADSTMVYQGYGLGADREQIAVLTDMLPVRPDLTLVLDVPVDVSVSRLATRGGGADRYERLGVAFFTRVRDGFRNVVDSDPARCVLVDGSRPESEVANDLFGIVSRRLLAPAVA